MNMKMSLYVRIATLGPVGYLTASGTVATMLTMPLMYLLRGWLPSELYLMLLIALLLIAVPIINSALDYFKEDQDPSQVVLDEVIGCLVTFYSIPLCWQTMLAGFLLFRLFDITKWFGIKKAEQLVGAWGVLIDDILAAILANVIIQLGYYLIVGK